MPHSPEQDFVAERQQAYRGIFAGPRGEMVLADLAKFCRAHESTFHADPQVAAFQEGRREVWLRIQQHLEMSTEQLWALFGAPGPRPATTENE